MFFLIIVPIYNVGKYLDECLKSIQNQTFSDFEVIIILFKNKMAVSNSHHLF